MIRSTREYQAITTAYGSKTAERSGVPKINHINEGLVILDAINASHWAKLGFCLHPLVQDDDGLRMNYEGLGQLDGLAVALAMEYRWVANTFLSEKIEAHGQTLVTNGRPELSCIKEVNDMLIADKVQNRKDFERHHLATHPRARELETYFALWLKVLGISEERYQELAARISQ